LRPFAAYELREVVMEKIKRKDITVTRHTADGFTLSWLSCDGNYYRKRYVGYSIGEAKRRFEVYVCREDAQKPKGMTRDDVLIEALRGLCGGDRKAARELLGNS
jgi:hypothetical protein